VSPGPSRHLERGKRAVALLLALAAIAAALVTARAALLIGDASGAWQSALRLEVKRSALALEDIRFVYGSEAVLTFGIAIAEVRAEEQRARASGDPELAAILEAEAQVYEGALEGLRLASEIASDPRYALSGGGYDLQLRIADARLRAPDTLAIDPDATMESGNRASERGVRMISSAVVVAFALLFGALAQSLKRRRMLLLVLGWAALLAGGSLAIAVEVVA